MLDATLIDLLPKLEPPILTVYLDTNPAKASNQGTPSGARIWLKSQGKALQADVPRVEQKVFRKQLERVDRFLETRPKRERGIMVVAGPKVWRVLQLQVDVDNELHWGGVVRTQLLWLLDEHQPCGVAVVDRSGASLLSVLDGWRWQSKRPSSLKSTPLSGGPRTWSDLEAGPAPRTVMPSINALRSIMRGCSVRQPNGSSNGRAGRSSTCYSSQAPAIP